MITPTYTKELSLLENYRLIAGVDEVGRGPLAGPVVSAVVIFNPEKIGKYRSKLKWWTGVRDSKALSPRRRGSIVEFIKENCLDFALGEASHREIDELNIHHASLLSMKRALENLKIIPEMVLIDGLFKISGLRQGYGGFASRQISIVDGDAKILSIAAASILAKVYRDDLMQKYSRQFPRYGFERHKGYNTLFHRKAIIERGMTAIHRMSFPTLQNILSKRFVNLWLQAKTLPR